METKKCKDCLQQHIDNNTRVTEGDLSFLHIPTNKRNAPFLVAFFHRIYFSMLFLQYIEISETKSIIHSSKTSDHLAIDWLLITCLSTYKGSFLLSLSIIYVVNLHFIYHMVFWHILAMSSLRSVFSCAVWSGSCYRR